MAGHVAVNRLLPLWVDGGSSAIGLDWVGHGLASGPAWHQIGGKVAYVMLVAMVGGHVVWGWAQWLGLKPEQVSAAATTAEGKKRRTRRWWGVNGVSVLVVVSWLAGGMGVVGRNGRVSAWVGKHYDELLRRVPFIEAYV